jgi:hypothetical protein
MINDKVDYNWDCLPFTRLRLSSITILSQYSPEYEERYNGHEVITGNHLHRYNSLYFDIYPILYATVLMTVVCMVTIIIILVFSHVNIINIYLVKKRIQHWG